MPDAPSARDQIPAYEPYLHLWILTTLIVVAPLLDLTKRSAGFFAAHRVSYLEIALGTLAAVVLLPVPIALVRRLVGRWPVAARALDGLLVTLAVALFSLQILRPHGDLASGGVLVCLSAAVGILAALMVANRRPARLFLSFLAPALLVVPLVFLLDPKIQELRSSRDSQSKIDEAAELELQDPPANVVLVVFDALSTSAMVDGELRVNPHRFPHMAALAADSLWFPNAVSAADHTGSAVPAMLSGELPEEKTTPTLATYPRNLFTLLGGSMRVVAYEGVLHLCPPELNDLDLPESARSSLIALTSDLGLLWLHRTLPRDLTVQLPPVDENLTGFLRLGGGGPVAQLRSFLERLGPPSPPSLYFAHLVIPHKPYLYAQTGRQIWRRSDPYPIHPREYDTDLERKDAHLVLYGRYLQQAVSVDALVGRVIERLRETGLYEDSLVIVTSDHGGRQRPEEYESDVLAVPLLIKTPGSVLTGTRSDVVSTRDLLPTILDLLEPESAPTQSRSYFAEDYRPPDRVMREDGPSQLTPRVWEHRDGNLRWTLEHYGLGDDPDSIYRAGAVRPDLIGLRVDPAGPDSAGPDSAGLSPARGFSARVDEPRRPVYDPASDHSPSLIRGSLIGGADLPLDRPPVVAISLNGVVQGVTRAWHYRHPNWRRFHVTIPPSKFRPGENHVEVWLVDPDRPGHLLGPLENAL